MLMVTVVTRPTTETSSRVTERLCLLTGVRMGNEGQHTVLELAPAAFIALADIGEIRSGEAFDLLQLLNTGHSGSLSTVHATSAKQGLARFTSCVLQSGIDIPWRAIIGDAVNFSKDRLEANRLFLYTQKTGVPVNAILPEFVLAALDAAPRVAEKFLFWSGNGSSKALFAVGKHVCADSSN
jgi:hypothetical protein